MKNVLHNKDLIILILSCSESLYYMTLQDFAEVNVIVALCWSVFNIAMVYRVVSGLCKAKKY